MKAPTRSTRSKRKISFDDPGSNDDSSPVTSPKVPFRYRSVKDICDVCGGESLGLRYGANVCNACGQFYLKCSSKSEIPPCENDQDCQITFKSRNGCRYCRFQKCLKAGMSLDADISQARKRKYSDVDSQSLEIDPYPIEDSNTSSDMIGSSLGAPDEEDNVCAVCGEESVGIRYGAKSCNACADFFFKYGRNPELHRYPKNCSAVENCEITFESRANCPFCRIKKCLAVGMIPKSQEQAVVKNQRPIVPIGHSEDFCSVCGDEAIGVRYGVKACRPCEEFYHRLIGKDPAKFMPTVQCARDGDCYINSTNRSDCRYCRIKKCIEVGMHSASASNSEFLRYFESKGTLNYEVPITEADEIPLYYNIEVPSGAPGVVCVVCGAASVGRRWGVEACDPCSQFFYINYGTKESMRCKHGQTCVITRENRYQCRYCRLLKCIAVGMDPSGFGTRSANQKRTKVDTPGFESMLASIGIGREGSTSAWGSSEDSNLSIGDSSPYSSSSSSNNSVDVPGSTLTGFQYSDTKLDNIIRLHMETCAFTVEKIQCIMEKSMDFVNIPTTNPFEPWRFFATQMDLELRQILSFINHIDGAPVNASIFKIYILRIFRALSPEGLFLQDGRFLDFPIFCALFGEPFAMEMVQFSEAIRALNLSDPNLALFIVLVLLESHNGIDSAPGKLVHEILRALESRVHNFHSLRQLLPKLDRINSNFQNYIVSWLQLNHATLQLPQVFSDVFNIPNKLAL